MTSLYFRILKMASAEQFAITPYCFKPKYSFKEESSNSSDGSNSEEECIGRLGTSERCKQYSFNNFSNINLTIRTKFM